MLVLPPLCIRHSSHGYRRLSIIAAGFSRYFAYHHNNQVLFTFQHSSGSAGEVSGSDLQKAACVASLVEITVAPFTGVGGLFWHQEL